MEPLISRRSTYALGLLLLIIVGLVISLSLVGKRQEIRQKAAPQTSLEISPATSTVNQGDEFSVSVVMNTAGNQVTKADLILTYDQQYLNGVSINAGPFMPQVDMPGLIRNGTARIILSAPTTAPVSGNGVIATISFRAINPTNATVINFNADTAISALGEPGNVLVTTQQGSVTINRTVNPDTTLTVSGPTSVSQGSDFNVGLQINTGTNLITSTDVYLAYDSSRVTGVNVDLSQGFLPNVLTSVTINNGLIHFSVGSTTAAPAQGSGTLATITFHAVANGNTQISFAPQTFVQAINSDENMRQTVNNLNVNVTGQSQNPSPTPSPMPTASPITYATPTPAPTATPGTGGANSSPTTNPCQIYQPTIPTNVFATALSTSQIRLSWTPQANVTHYGIIFGTGSHYYSWGANNVGNVSSYVVSQLAANTTYYFAVFSVNDCGASGYSSETSARTQSAGTGGAVIASPANYASPKTTTPSPVPTPPPGFIAIDPNQSETEVIPFLAAKPMVSPVLVPSVVPQVSVPPEYQDQKAKVSPFLTPLGGILMIVLAIVLGIFFFRMRS